MFQQIQKNITAYKYLNTLRFKKLLTFRTSLIIQVLGMVLNNLFFFAIWYLLLNKFGNINGYTLTDFLFIQGYLVFIYAISNWLYGNLQKIGQINKEDGFLELQLYPVNPLVLICNRSVKASLVGDLLQAAVFLAVYFYLVPASLVWFLPSVFVVIFGLLGLNLLINSLPLHYPKLYKLPSVWNSFFLSATAYPANSFYSPVKVAIYLLGFWTVYFVPVEVVRGSISPVELTLSLIFSVVVNILGFWAWNTGLKKVESGGGIGLISVD